MGLFDGIFDPDTYSDEGGGLLGRLLPAIQAGGYTPPPTGSPSDSDTPAVSMPLPVASATPSTPQTPDYGQTQNVAIGNYQMPQFGSADATQAAPSAPDFGDRLSAGFQSWAHTPVGNPMAALANGIQGFNSGQCAGLANNAQPDLNAQFQQLRPLLGDRNAMIATVHPEMGQALIAQALSKLQSSGNADDADSSANGQATSASAATTPAGPPPLAMPALPANKPARYAAPATHNMTPGNPAVAWPRKPKTKSSGSALYGQ